MPTLRRLFGNRGERAAERFLVEKGYRILARQYRNRYGEIDLIAEDGGEIVFVEVKTRRTSRFGYPEESVTKKKLERMLMVAEAYLRTRPDRPPYRIDVIAIEGADFSRITHFEAVDLA